MRFLFHSMHNARCRRILFSGIFASYLMPVTTHQYYNCYFITWYNVFIRRPGPKFTDNLRIIIRHFRTYDNLMTTGEFTEHLRQSQDVSQDKKLRSPFKNVFNVSSQKSMSPYKGQGHSEAECTFLAEHIDRPFIVTDHLDVLLLVLLLECED